MSSPVKTRLNRPPPGCRGPQLGWLSTSLKHFAQHMDAVWVVLSFVGVLAIFGGGVLFYLRRKRAGQLPFRASVVTQHAVATAIRSRQYAASLSTLCRT